MPTMRLRRNYRWTAFTLTRTCCAGGTRRGALALAAKASVLSSTMFRSCDRRAPVAQEGFMPAERAIGVQGIFLRGAAPGNSTSKTLQPKGAVQRRPGMEAFPVELRPKSGGWPLPRDVQQKMEKALGASFSDVRVHVGPEAASIGAIAFTWGSDIHFAPGQYNPHTPHGQFLLGHELTHVVQQRAGRVANPFGSGVAVVQDQALEAEADRLGHMAASSKMPEAGSSSGAPAAAPQTGAAAITRKAAKHPGGYAVRPPRMSQDGWEISVGAPGQSGAVGS